MSYVVGDTTVYYFGGPESQRQYASGEPTSIEEIREKWKETGELYVDPDFPPEASSLGNLGGDPAQGIANLGEEAKTYKWIRAPELVRGLGSQVTAFLADEAREGRWFSERDVRQGDLADCWYMAALAALTRHPEKIQFVVPEDNYLGFVADRYCGAFHFRFYDPAMDKWFDVVVDDFLPAKPAKDAAGNDLWLPAFAKFSGSKYDAGFPVAELWVSLLEKAFAKFYGNFDSIEGGIVNQALTNFTGGFGEVVVLSKDSKRVNLDDVEVDHPKLLKRLIRMYLAGNGFVGLGTFGSKAMAREYQAAAGYENYGLLTQHAYSVLAAAEVEAKDGSASYYLLKVRNPHARGEWTGAFSDNDPTWDKVTPDLRTKSAVTGQVEDEGVFWMQLEDCIKYFLVMDFAIFNSPKDDDDTTLNIAKGQWPADLQTRNLEMNDQVTKYFTGYKFEVKQGSLENVSEIARERLGNRTLATLSVVVHGYNSRLASILFFYCLYKIENEAELKEELAEKIEKKQIVESSGQSWGRECSRWHILYPGTYVVIPVIMTSRIPKQLQGKDIGFTLRIFTQNETEIEEIPPVASE